MRMPQAALASFFVIQAGEYENFTFTASTARTVTTFVLAICASIILAALYNFYVRYVPGGVARLLLEKGATSPETALSAEELGLLSKPFALWELLRGTALRRFVTVVEPEKAPEETADRELRFYIPEELKYRVETRFERKGNGVAALVLTAVGAVVVAFALIKLIPLLLSLIDGML